MNKEIRKRKENNQNCMSSGEPHRLPKEAVLPDWARRDKQGTEGGRVERTNVCFYVTRY